MAPSSKHDVVYFMKECDKNEEFTYSVRSVEANFPHRKIWVYGGLPHNMQFENYVGVQQLGRTKWERTTNMLKKIALNDDITEDFFLFNDDFFVMHPVKNIKPYYNGDLYKRIVNIENRNNYRTSPYSMMLRKTANELDSRGLGCLNYAVHMPMLVNRKKILEVLAEFPNCPMFRALYGNYCKIGGEFKYDVKIYDNTKEAVNKESVFLSTDDAAWRKNTAGVTSYIKESFPNKSKFEL